MTSDTSTGLGLTWGLATIYQRLGVSVMPNMLAHYGVQGVVTRLCIRDADPKWTLLGCLIPDLPWILQRLGRVLLPGLDLYDLRLYAIVQASFAACLLLCGALALMASAPWKVFRILALNALLHLLLDACQTKWANGVHLVAPFSWRLFNIGLFWPESLPTLLLTLFGLVYVIYLWRCADVEPRSPWRPALRRSLFALLLLGMYTLVPLVFLSAPYAQDNHSIKTLRERPLRTGRAVEFDRMRYLKRPTGDVIRTFAREELDVIGAPLDHTAIVSVRASFVDPGRIHIRHLHVHWGRARDVASYLGLLLLVAYWVRPCWQGDH